MIVMLFVCIGKYLCVYDKNSLELRDEIKLTECDSSIALSMKVLKNSHKLVIFNEQDKLLIFHLSEGRASKIF